VADLFPGAKNGNAAGTMLNIAARPARKNEKRGNKHRRVDKKSEKISLKNTFDVYLK
jgi:hypothetical protein